MNLKKYDNFYDFNNQIPKVVFWVNYWGEDIINNFKINEKMLETVYEYEVLKDSCYIRLQKEPIDAFNNQHMEFQNKINRMLNL